MKLILHLAETQVSAARVAQAIGSLKQALDDDGSLGETERQMLLEGAEIHGTLHPGDGQEVVPDSDLTMLLAAHGLQRRQGETAHQVLHRAAAAARNQ